MDQINSRLYIFTGKGGVGKTTLALSYALNLQQKQQKKVKLVYFKNDKLSSSSNNGVELEQYKSYELNDLNIESIELKNSMADYMARKLKSRTIANWILKTPFFLSLISMLPSFHYVIYLGQILDDLESDPELIVVLDAPASGHVLTMLEATQNFSDIFQSGLVYKDTLKIINTLYQENYVKIFITTLPTQLAFTESSELKESLNKLSFNNIEIICNHSFLFLKDISPLPQFLMSKVKIEDELIEKHPAIQKNFPFIPYTYLHELVSKISLEFDK